MDRLDRTLDHFVDDQRMTPDLAEDLRREYHHEHVDVKQRIAELAGYAGAALAVLGIVVIGSQVWSDFSQVVRAGLPAVGSAALMVASWMVVRSVPHLSQHPVRARLAEVVGVCAAVLGTLAVAVAFPREENDYGNRFNWQMTLAFAVGLLLAFVVSRWAPGLISTLACAMLLFMFVTTLLGAARLDDGPGPYGLVMVVLGVAGVGLLYRFFPPAWFTQFLGIWAWLLGDLMLILSREEYGIRDEPYWHWMWIGRVSALVLIVLGSWLFIRGGQWPWAIGAVLSIAMLVGLWSAEALNAGVALVLTGLVLIAVGLGLFLWRRSTQGSASLPEPGTD